jgi:hypothetical protein
MLEPNRVINNQRGLMRSRIFRGGWIDIYIKKDLKGYTGPGVP